MVYGGGVGGLNSEKTFYMVYGGQLIIRLS